MLRTTVLLFIVLTTVTFSFAQVIQAPGQGNPPIPSLVVTPTEVTLTPGEWHRFRAVGVDGRLLTGVQWSIYPVYAADLRPGDEPEVSCDTPKQFQLIAHYGGRTASASVTVVSGYWLKEGATKWVVKELPGFRTVKLTPAVPVDGGPDVFAEEVLGVTRIVRAYTEDGRELWRAPLHGTLSPDFVAEQMGPSLKEKSICDSLKVGDSKKDVAAFRPAKDYADHSELFDRSHWTLEESGVTCHVYFDGDGKVLKKRRELTN